MDGLILIVLLGLMCFFAHRAGVYRGRSQMLAIWIEALRAVGSAPPELQPGILALSEITRHLMDERLKSPLEERLGGLFRSPGKKPGRDGH